MTGHCPTINGQKPNEEFDLDNQSHLATLGYHQIKRRGKSRQVCSLPSLRLVCHWMEGLRIYHNFIRPHTALDGKTPAQKANIESDEAKWMSLIKKATQ